MSAWSRCKSGLPTPAGVSNGRDDLTHTLSTVFALILIGNVVQQCALRMTPEEAFSAVKEQVMNVALHRHMGRAAL